MGPFFSIPVLLGLALLAPLAVRVLGTRTGWMLGAVSAALAASFAVRLPVVEPIVWSWSWVPSLGIDLALRVDGLAAGFALMVTGIGAFVLVYAQGYLGSSAKAGRLFSYLLLFEAAMLGLVLSDDLISLFVFWELTSLASFLMVGFDHEKESARRAARKALVITGAGGLALLVGFLLMRIAGAQLGLDPGEAGRISGLATLDLTAHPWYGAILALVLLGAFTKSAQVPFHFWLPAAMAAPTPVSAYLHSATMVKAGVFLLARLHPTLGGTEAWQVTLTTVGLVTMGAAAWMSLHETDLKRILAYSTVSVLGILTALLGLGTSLAIKAMVVFLAAHALYKASLFMIAGILDHQTGTREVGALSGLRRLMPLTALAGAVAALSKAGAPPMFGFVGKELLYKAKLDFATLGDLIVLLAVLTNIALVATAFLVGVKPFFGRTTPTPKPAREAPVSMLLGPLCLGVLGLFVGLVPGYFDAAVGGPMASAIFGEPLEMKLALWHGVSASALTVLGLSVLTLLVGFLVFLRLRRRQRPKVVHEARFANVGPDSVFERIMEGLPVAAGRLTQLLHGGPLRRDLLVTVAAAGAIVLVPLLGQSIVLPGLAGTPTAVEIAAVVFVLAGAVLLLVTRESVGAVLALGVVGLGVALLFLVWGAPDLAITQLMVETLTVVLLVAVLLRIPGEAFRERVHTRAADALVSLVLGVGVFLTVLAAGAVPRRTGVAEFFAAASLPEAKGRNVVNVILVDFRALDTLGETVVLALAGIGVFALLRAGRSRGQSEKETGR